MEKFIRYFVRHLTVERGLSENTVRAYGSDLLSLADYLQNSGKTEWSQVDREILLDFLDHLRDAGMESTSIARHLTALKMFFRYLCAEGLNCSILLSSKEKCASVEDCDRARAALLKKYLKENYK